MAETDKKITTVYNELKTAIAAAESDVNTKDTAAADATIALNAARVDLRDKQRKKTQLETLYPELVAE